MNNFNFKLTANYRNTPALPPIEEQYGSIWKFAMFLASIGIPLEWYPSADSPEIGMLNRAFDISGVTAAALAIARTMEKAKDIRFIAAWNGKEEAGGIGLKNYAMTGVAPSNFSMDARGVNEFADVEVAVSILVKVIELWNPLCIQCAPFGYEGVFEDRPSIGWMLYLPQIVTKNEATKAARLVPILGDKKKQIGTIVISVNEPFDLENADHVKAANDIEIELVGKDVLPLRRELFKRLPPSGIQ